MSIECSGSDLDDAQQEWYGREGDAWAEFEDAYLSAWPKGCEVALENAGYHDELYANNVSVDSYDCELDRPAALSVLADGVPDYPPDDPYTAGEELAVHDGCVHLFAMSPTGYWSYGDETYDDSVCPDAPSE
jgi:hypothetical protein